MYEDATGSGRRNASGAADPVPREAVYVPEEREAYRRMQAFIRCALASASALGIQVTSPIALRDRATGAEFKPRGRS